MLPSELLELARNICKQKSETQTVEIKSAHVDCPKRLYDTLSSFSNQDTGGILLFGIDEKSGYQVVGVYDPQDLQKKGHRAVQSNGAPCPSCIYLGRMERKRVDLFCGNPLLGPF